MDNTKEMLTLAVEIGTRCCGAEQKFTGWKIL